MKILCGIIALLSALASAEQDNFTDSNLLNRTLFNCSGDDFCSNIPALLIFPDGKVNFTGENGAIPLKGRLLKPRSGPRCWNNSEYTCCALPCEINPCVNDGKCVNNTWENESFRCDCPDGYTGDWCEEFEGCEKCHKNAKCNVTAKSLCSCKEGYVGDGTSYCTAVCPFFSVPSDLLGKCGDLEITFNKTFENYEQKSEQKCPRSDNKEGRSVATIDCPANALEFDVATFHCVPCNKTIDALPPVKNVTSPEQVEEILNELPVLTSEVSKPASAVAETTNYLESLADSLRSNTSGEAIQISQESMKNVVEIVQNLGIDLLNGDKEETQSINKLDASPRETEENREKRNATRKLVKVLDDFARLVNLTNTPNKTVTFTGSKMSLQITEPEKKSGDSYDDMIVQPDAYLPQTNASVAPQISKPVKMTIPAAALAAMEKLAGLNPGESMRLVFVLHQDASLLTVDKRTGQVVQATFKAGESSTGAPTAIDGQTIQIEYSDPQEETPEQEKAVQGTNYETKLDYFCVFWDFLNEEWATEGCEFKNESSRYYCECNHFTSFALLLRVTATLKDYEPNIYSLFACSLSVFCLFVTVLIYLLVKDLRSRRPTPILINICVNLAIGYLLFVIGMDGKYKGFSDIQCYLSAIIMHVAFLCAWFWMLLYSVNMYYALVKVVVGSTPLVAKKAFMYLVGYGVPIIIVATDVIVSTELDKLPRDIEADNFESHYLASHVCWVRHMSMYLGFATPVAAILVINLVLFFLIIRKLTWKKMRIQSNKEAASHTQQIFMAATMATMMGLTWIFGYIMLVSPDPSFQEVMSTIFDIFNTCQGVVIFLVSCVRQKAVRNLWLRPVGNFVCCKRQARHKSFSVSESGFTASTTDTMKNGSKDTTAL